MWWLIESMPGWKSVDRRLTAAMKNVEKILIDSNYNEIKEAENYIGNIIITKFNI